MLDLSANKKQIMLSKIAALIELADGKDYKSVSDALSEVREKLTKEIFYLVVLGEFKRGKSTFINALLGENVLPTAIVPLTSIITKISYGTESSATVYYQKGDAEEISLDIIERYITEKGNPNNEKKVNYLEVFYPSDILAKGTVLIDTPGTGSIFEHNTLETYEFIPRVDAALFLLTVDHPLSQTEYDFLKDVRAQVPSIYFVLNKIDHAADADREESEIFIRNNLSTQLALDEVKIFPLSARLALQAKINNDRNMLQESRLPVLEKELIKLLEEDKSQVILSSAAAKTRTNADKLKFQLELEEKAFRMPLEELKVKEEKLKEFLEEARRKAREQRLVIEGEVKTLLDDFVKELNREREEEIKKQEKLLEQWFAEHRHLPARKLMDQWNLELYKSLTGLFDHKKQVLEDKLEEKLWLVFTEFIERAQKLVSQVEKETAELFAVNLPAAGEIDILPEREDFHFKIGTLYDFFPEDPDFFIREKKFILRLLPPFPGKQLIYNEMKNIVVEQVDRNYGRLREDLSKRVNSGTQQIIRGLDQALATLTADLEKALQAALEQHEKSSTGFDDKLRKLQQQKKKLESIREELTGEHF